MATSIKKTNTATKSVVKQDTADELVKETKKTNTKKTFKDTDMIMCRSVTNGELFIIGQKTNIVYKFADYGDEQSIEYQDLLYAVRSKSKSIYKPRLIILDNDFIEQNANLLETYDNMYTKSDLRNILNLTPSEIKRIVPTLPSGAQDALKGLVSTAINSGNYDSANKIKAFDEVFGTKMLLVLTENY